MNCLDFRRAVGAEPSLTSAQLQAHRTTCAACARFQDEMRALDARISRALAVDLPRTGAVVRRRRPAALLALAASVVAAMLTAGALWLLRPAPTLADELAAHIDHEPEALVADSRLPAQRVNAVLSQSGLALRGDPGAVVYARNCPFEGHQVPHLVVRGPSGPVTVMLLLHHPVREPQWLVTSAFEGYLLPATRGSIAVLGGDARNLRALARRVEDAVVWPD